MISTKTNIKAARERARMQQKECADAIGVTLRAWQSYEQGIREPKYETLCDIATLFNVSTDYLLGRDTGEPTAMDRLGSEFNMSALEKEILDGYLNLPENMRGDLMEFLQKAVEKVMTESGGEDYETETYTCGELEDALEAQEGDAKSS